MQLLHSLPEHFLLSVCVLSKKFISFSAKCLIQLTQIESNKECGNNRTGAHASKTMYADQKKVKK